MASSFLDVCRFNPTLGGTTDWTYSSAITGYQSPAAAGAVNGAIYSYRAESNDLSQWEVGYGVYTSGVLTRATVLFNSLGTTAKINFLAAPQVAIVALSQDLTSASVFKSFISGKAVSGGTVDDTTAIQNLINANPSGAVLDGQGLSYRITSALTLPAGSTRLTIQNATFLCSGDIQFLSVASGTAQFFKMERCLIDCSGHTTVDRVMIDFSRMSEFEFKDIQVNGVAGKTWCWYGTGVGGASPYYGVWDHCYGGNFNIGIMINDAAGAALGPNTNTIKDCRLQPGPGSIAIYLGAYSQQARIRACAFEYPSGGTGVWADGTDHIIEDDNRFEGLTTAINVQSTLVNSKIGKNLYSGTGPFITWNGLSRKNNTIEWDVDLNNSYSAQGGLLSRSAAGGIGYAVGSGLNIAQATSKSTSVTLNSINGEITLQNTSIAANGIAQFTFFNNTTSSTTDLIYCGYTGGTSGAYFISGANLGGAFTITVRNLTAGALAEAIVVQYIIIRSSRT